MNIKLDPPGFKQLLAQLEQLGAVAGQKLMAQAARKAMKPVLEDAQALVPVRTGALRAAMKLTTAKPRSGDTVAAAGISFRKGTVEWDADEDLGIGGGSGHGRSHWHFIELGIPSRGIQAQPFLRPAFDRNKDKVLAILKVELNKLVRKAVLRQLASEIASRSSP